MARLALEGVTVDFGGVRAVDHATLETRPGEIVGLIGPNGAGKSTLLNTISGLVRPDEGRIAWDEQPLGGLSPHRLSRHGVWRTFQHPELFGSLTVMENLLAVDRPGTRRVLRQVFGRPTADHGEGARRAIASDLLQELGLAAWADTEARSLPYGVRKITELARVAFADPRLLLLDEPAAGLNAHEKQHLRTVIAALRVRLELTMVLVEHDLGLVMSLCDRIYVMNFGRIIAEGPPQQVARDPDVIEAYLGTDADAA